MARHSLNLLINAVPLVMEDDSNRTQQASTSATEAGICNGFQSDCVALHQGHGTLGNVRQHAQLRLSSCHVDAERLKSSSAHQDKEYANRSKEIRRYMHRMYGEPDQDYDDWQIVVLSDMESGGLPS
jgi:hypothetical protein